MPSATTTKSAMAGTKRKSAPGKDSHKKDTKKAKTEKEPYVKKPKVKSAPPVKKVQEPTSEEEDFDSDIDSDGGAPIGVKDIDLEDQEDEDEEDLPKASDGLHPERAKAVVINSQSSKEAHAKQKQLVKERKAAKPLADGLARTKKIWERLRRKSHVPKEERKELVTELFELITGRMKDFVLKHDSVRVVQTAIKYANPEQKRIIAKELAGSYRQLAESRYAKFLIGKLLVQNDDEIRDIIVPEFFGHVRRLIKHPEASWILDDVYRGIATKQQKAIILREWYGAEFALFDKGEAATGELTEILAAEPGKRAPIMKSLQELINHLIQKKMTGFTLLHDAMLQYFLNVKPGTEEISDYLELIEGDEEGDLLKNLAFTKSGARVVCLALAYGTAKDRKKILKTYKDTLQMMAADANGHKVILTAYETIDDTKLSGKSIFPELLSKDADKQVENVVNAANDPYARTTLLYLFQGKSKSLFPPNLNTTLELLAEIETARAATSKKDPEIRRTELIKAVSADLLKAIEVAAADLVATSFGCQFVTEVLFHAEGDKTAALKAVAETAGGDPTYTQPAPAVVEEGAEAELEEPSPSSHIATQAWGGRMFKSLIAGGRFDPATKSIKLIEPPLNFADILYPNIEDNIVEWATGSSSFVPLALLESPSFSSKDALLKKLKENKKKLEKAAKEETPEQKLKREEFEEKMAKEGDDKKKSKKMKGGKERKVGNEGSSLLLALL